MNIYKGENAIIRTTLLQVDGTTPLNVTDLLYVRAEIINVDKVLASFELGEDDEIREGATANELEVEVPHEVSARFTPTTKVYQKIYLRVANSEFESDGEQRDIDQHEIFTVVG